MEWMIDWTGKGESISVFCSWHPAGLHRTLPWPIIPWDRWQSTEFCGLHIELCWEGWSTLVPSFLSFVVCNLRLLYIKRSAVFMTSTNAAVAGGVTGCSIWSDRYGCMLSVTNVYCIPVYPSLHLLPMWAPLQASWNIPLPGLFHPFVTYPAL
jgi:hypothetical protein